MANNLGAIGIALWIHVHVFSGKIHQNDAIATINITLENPSHRTPFDHDMLLKAIGCNTKCIIGSWNYYRNQIVPCLNNFFFFFLNFFVNSKKTSSLKQQALPMWW